MALRESALNGYSPIGKVLVCVLWRKVRFLKGERGEPIYWCMLFRTNSLLSFLVFFPFLSVFVLIFFSFPLTLLFLLRCEKILCFLIPYTGHGKGLFIVPAVISVLLFCPLTTFVWSGCTCQSYKNPCQTEADPFCLSVRRGLILSFCVPRPFLPRC